MGPPWVVAAPGGHHVGPMNLTIKDGYVCEKYIFSDTLWNNTLEYIKTETRPMFLFHYTVRSAAR